MIKRETDKKYDVVIYHGQCPDGIGAAWAAWRHLGDAATYISMQHGDHFNCRDYVGKRVLFVDFALPRELMHELYAQCAHVAVVDHHVTQIKALAGLPNVHIDLTHSGAVLSWAHFAGCDPDADEVPDVLKYIQDRDLDRWQLPDSHAYLAAFDSNPISIETVNMIDRNDVRSMIEFGEPIVLYNQQQVKRIVEHAVIATINRDDVKINERIVPICNVTSRDLITSTCDVMMTTMGYDIAATWYYDGKSMNFRVSLRSANDSDIDVSALAAKFGGGGHVHAAGFTVDDISEAFEFPVLV